MKYSFWPLLKEVYETKVAGREKEPMFFVLAVELLICKASASQGKEAANFFYWHSSAFYVCI